MSLIKNCDIIIIDNKSIFRCLRWNMLFFDWRFNMAKKSNKFESQFSIYKVDYLNCIKIQRLLNEI